MKQLTLMVCNHNHGRFIRQLLGCIFDQTLNPEYWKLLIIHDGCTDNSQQIFNDEWENLCAIRGKKKDWLECKQLVRPKKEGLAKCKNFGLKHIDTEFVAYIDVDDGMFPQRLEMQLNFLNENKDIAAVFTQAWDRDRHGRLLINCFKDGEYITYEQIKEGLRYQNVLMHGSAMIRMDTLINVGFYDESEKYKGCEDYELWIRMINRGYRFYKLNYRLNIYSLNCSVPR